MDHKIRRPRYGVERFADLAARLALLTPSCGDTRIVAVDGPGGAGKSTFAARLAAAAGAAQVVHTDDFASWENQFGWFPRLLAEVIEPLRRGQAGRYRRYDWEARSLAEGHDVLPAPVLLVEGVGAGRREFTTALACVVWIETPPEVRLARGIERDGEEMRAFWNQWIAGEHRHFAQDRMRDRASLVVCGNPPVAHDPGSEYVTFGHLSPAPR